MWFVLFMIACGPETDTVEPPAPTEPAPAEAPAEPAPTEAPEAAAACADGLKAFPFTALEAPGVAFVKADLDVMLLCQMGDEAPRPSGVDRARVLTAAPPEMSVCVDDAQAKALASCDQIAVLIAPNP